jgi:hypothetical protein
MYEDQAGVETVSKFLLYRTVRAELAEASRDGQSFLIDLLNDTVLLIVQQLQPRREKLPRRRCCRCGRWYRRVVEGGSVVTGTLFA